MGTSEECPVGPQWLKDAEADRSVTPETFDTLAVAIKIALGMPDAEIGRRYLLSVVERAQREQDNA